MSYEDDVVNDGTARMGPLGVAEAWTGVGECGMDDNNLIVNYCTRLGLGSGWRLLRMGSAGGRDGCPSVM